MYCAYYMLLFKQISYFINSCFLVGSYKMRMNTRNNLRRSNNCQAVSNKYFLKRQKQQVFDSIPKQIKIFLNSSQYLSCAHRNSMQALINDQPVQLAIAKMGRAIGWQNQTIALPVSEFQKREVEDEKYQEQQVKQEIKTANQITVKSNKCDQQNFISEILSTKQYDHKLPGNKKISQDSELQRKLQEILMKTYKQSAISADLL